MRPPLVVGLSLFLVFLGLALPVGAQEDDWGFDDEETYVPDVKADEEDPHFWDLGGDLSLGSSYNYRSHSSATGTHYGNLSRLRAQLDLQLDLDLPWEWKMRVEGYGFYDFTYIAKGRSRYTDDVRDDYIWETDFREVWLQGSLGRSVDLKVGRQIVNWGRSDTVRVLDVLNPLDNREPGLVDIEDLRLPVTMARVDYYPRWVPEGWGEWSAQAVVIPEFRQDRNPSIGSDFNPSPVEVDLQSNKPDRFFDDPEYGGAITGTFSGWDISLYAARVRTNRPVVVGLLQRHSLSTMVGAGGNLTFGSWLLKSEIAWFDNIDYASVPAGDPANARLVDKSRLDSMAGVEYYGFNDLQVAFEVVHRHIFRYDGRMKFRVPEAVPPSPFAPISRLQLAYAEEDSLEGALRVTADFMNSRLKVTGVALVLMATSHEGSVIRGEASYELMEALQLSGGIVLYQSGSNPGFEDVAQNDRLFLRLEYSF